MQTASALQGTAVCGPASAVLPRALSAGLNRRCLDEGRAEKLFLVIAPSLRQPERCCRLLLPLSPSEESHGDKGGKTIPAA